MSKIIVGTFGGEKWVGTNDEGVGRLLFKLDESETIFEELTTLRQQNAELVEHLGYVMKCAAMQDNLLIDAEEIKNLLSKIKGDK